MFCNADHPAVPLPDWRTFVRDFPTDLIAEVIDQSKLGLPSWFVPSARGVAIASNVLLRGALYNWASTSARSQRSDSFIIQFSASCSDSKPLTYCIRPLTHWMKTRQPSPAGVGTASNAANLSVNRIRESPSVK
jgi:hypothetical protein